MTISLNQIDELRERTGVNYSDAKEALESCSGDMLGAIVYLEKNKKAKASRKGFSMSGLSDKIGSLLTKGSNTRIKMHKQERVIFNISVDIAALIGIILFPLIELIAVGLLIALLTGYRFRFESTYCDTANINQVLDKVYNSVDNAKDKLSGSMAADNKNTAE